MGKIAVYPGSFDPVTNGHCDIVRRGLGLFDEVVVAIARNGAKDPLFTIEERLEMLHETFKEMPGVQVDSFDGLLVDYVVKRQADAILRGLRAVSDFEYEFQLALMNRKGCGGFSSVPRSLRRPLGSEETPGAWSLTLCA